MTLVAGWLTLAAVIALSAGWLLPRRTRQWRRLQWTLFAVPLSALTVAAVVVSAASSAMLLTTRQLLLVVGSLVFGVALGMFVAVALSRVLVEDLRRVTATTRRIGAGETDARTDVQRRDEVGQLARNVDDMVQRLRVAEQERAAQQRSRQLFLAAVSHDLRTPLASLQAALEAVQDGLAHDPDRYLRSMSTDVAELRRLIDDLFTLTRLETGVWRPVPEPVEIDEMALEVGHAVSSTGDDVGVQVTVLSPGAAWTDADPVGLARVLRNLMDNAVRHAPEGSEVRVRVEEMGGEIVVSILDDGPGFPADFVHAAFDHFTRVDAARVRGGVGLGLAICREVVEQHGGRIWAEPGPGGTVRFALPALPPERRPAAVPAG